MHNLFRLVRLSQSALSAAERLRGLNQGAEDDR
jgi:hypothetical protein